jgi:hypothetical protein
MNKRWVKAAMAGLLAVPAGSCTWGMPYAYPTLDYVARMPVNAPADEVYAFRVDRVREQSYAPERVEKLHRSVVTPLARLPTVGPVVRPAYCYGIIGQVLWWPWGTHVERNVRVVLYRRGYRVVVLLPWESPEAVRWEPAPSLADQGHAVQVLQTELSADPSTAGGREALRFTAEECERMARLGPADAAYDPADWREWAKRDRDAAEGKAGRH